MKSEKANESYHSHTQCVSACNCAEQLQNGKRTPLPLAPVTWNEKTVCQ